MAPIHDYLTKQIYIERNVVTFRSLSRQFNLHVNEAKNELAKFHADQANAKTHSSATYLLSGELLPAAREKKLHVSQSGDGMDVDFELPGDDEVEEVSTLNLTLVGEDALEHTKAKYARIFSIHIYCLSPSPIKDAGLVCEPFAVVHAADAKDTPTSSLILGRIVGPDVKIGKALPPVASSSKIAQQPLSRKPTLKAKTEEEPAEREKSNVIKPKASGKLDWSKAKKADEKSKPKVKKEDTSSDVKVKEKNESPVPLPKVKAKASVKHEDTGSPKDESKQRGVKRKAAPPPASDTEEDPQPNETGTMKGKVKVKETTPLDVKLRKNRIVSDDEDEDMKDAPRSKPLVKGRTKASAAQSILETPAERSLRAMMDIDDSQVERASSGRIVPKSEPQDSDVEMAEEVEAASEPPVDEDDDIEAAAPKPKPRKKKEKKVVPVGRNGLKKKRVIKSRMSTDAKGYMVTEDYSSYESVDEEEEEPPKKTKTKKALSKTKKSDEEASQPKSKPAVSRTSSIKGKSGGAKSSGQGNLKDFFGKPKKSQ